MGLLYLNYELGQAVLRALQNALFSASPPLHHADGRNAPRSAFPQLLHTAVPFVLPRR
jgi:hypothetical protein